MFKITSVEKSGDTVIVSANWNDACQVSISFDQMGVVQSCTFAEDTKERAQLEDHARAVIKFSIPIEMEPHIIYTDDQVEQMKRWYESLIKAEKTIAEMDQCIVEADWLSDMFGQTSGSIIDALFNVRAALDPRINQ